ncbi:unnamed protein product [Linum tenue]|uniref:Uncharacterized protein n=1 Tax=Linum tenue TaxID=586396 RepID=A0AAV0KUS2_9ROSI|nr:unnamed protein product [Linum tenue]
MGLRQFPPPGEKPQKVRLLGGGHRSHGRNRQGFCSPACPKRNQSSHRRPEP